MPYSFENIEFIEAFVRNLGEVQDNADKYAQRFGDALESKVRQRIEQGIYLGGDWESEPYSTNPIKAYKLGSVVVSGEGMSKQMTINGIVIDRDDWYWGEWDREMRGISLSGRRRADWEENSSPRPTPVFIPGYYGWRVQYNGLGSVVDLNFSGNMLDNFSVDIVRTRGSNQYGGNFYLDFVVEQPFEDIGHMTNYYRQWMAVTEDEVEEAIRESGADIARILLL